MLKNYLKIALRNLLRYKGFTVINISGLSIGIACCILIMLYVKYEFSYDKLSDNSYRTYRVYTELSDAKSKVSFNLTSGPMGPALAQEFPEVEMMTRIRKVFRSTPVFSFGENDFYEEGLFAADSDFFKIFQYKFIEGNPNTALTAPYSIVLTKKDAHKYFSDTDPFGKTIKVNDKYNFKVTGVIQDIPDNTHFKFNSLVSFTTLNDLVGKNLDNWFYFTMRTYVLLKNKNSAESLQAMLPGFIQNHIGKEAAKDGNVYRLFLQPITDIHFNSNLLYEFEPGGDKAETYGFAAIGILILLIACINFMNLSTARSLKRSKEVGLRKVMGAGRGRLIKQFLGESIIITIFSVIISVLLVIIFLPVVNSMFPDRSFSISEFSFPEILISLIAIIGLVGIVSGSYPALFLSRFNAGEIINGKMSDRRKGTFFRKAFVVIQFAISIALIIGTLTINNQLSYIRNKDIGFDKNYVMVISVSTTFKDKFDALRNSLLGDSRVKAVSYTSNIPGETLPQSPYIPEGNDYNSIISLPTYDVDMYFAKTLGLKFKEGRDFSEKFPSDEQDAFIINESAEKKLGWKNSVGKTMEWTIGPKKKGKIIGVVKDFNYLSLHDPVAPVVLQIYKPKFRFIMIKISSHNIQDVITSVQNNWKRVLPAFPPEYKFLDESYQKLYISDFRFEKIINYFSILSILIACLGLAGLTSYSVEQRKKEIGIRKVLGASVTGIVIKFSLEQLALLAISTVIAFPAAYYFMSKWLDDFAYRININLWIFVFAALITFMIAIITVSLNSVKASLENPADTLRYE